GGLIEGRIGEIVRIPESKGVFGETVDVAERIGHGWIDLEAERSELLEIVGKEGLRVPGEKTLRRLFHGLFGVEQRAADERRVRRQDELRLAKVFVGLDEP